MQEGKSKRDLIWEQKKRAREALLQNGGAGAGSQNIPEDNNPPPIFQKKSPLYDNPEPEVIKPTQPLGSQDTNRTRKFANVIDDINNNKPASQPSNNNPGMQVRDFAQQDNQYQPRVQFADQEPPMMNQNQPRRHVEEPMQGGPKPNFNPSFQQSAGYEPIVGRESREGGLMDPRKKKADYGEELRNQMKIDQMRKQQEKNEVRNSQNLNQQQQGGDQYFKEMERRRKDEYGDYLKQQMQAKQDAKRQEIARDMYERPPLQQNFPPQQPYSQRNQQQQQQQVYPPPQQQQIQQPISRQQQPQYQQPERLEMNNDPYAQRQAGYAIERAGSVDLQRGEIIDYGRGNSLENVDNLMPRYQRGNTLEAGGERGKRKGFESEDPMELAKKDRMKQDFQKGLQEQVEFKKRQKEMEKQRQLQEDRIEEERIRKEQEELARRQAEEDPKKKVMAKLQNMEQNANNLMQQQQQFVKEKPARNRGNVQSFDQQSRAPPSQDPNQFQPPPSFQPSQQPSGYNPQQGQQPPPYYPPPYGHAYPYAQPYPAPYGYPGYPPGHPGQPYYPPPQHPASFPSMPRNEAITSELQQIRAEIQNQQAVFAKQLQMIQKEAMNVVDGRDKAEQELLHLRERLKEKINHDHHYDKNLRDVLERNNPNAPIRKKDNNPVRAVHRDPEPALEAYSYQTYQPKSNKANPNPGSRNHIEKNYEEFTFPAAPDIDKPAYEVRRTNQKMKDDDHLHPMDDSYMPALDIEKTLSGNTKMIPLAVFDNKPGLENTRSLDRDPLTLSKIHNFASSNLGQMHSNKKNDRPNSSKQWQQKDEDSIDFLIKAHGARPGSSESHGYGDTSHMIGRRLDEASELLRQVDVMGKDRTNLRSRDKETFSMAGRNILGDKQSMNVGNYGGKRGGYPESERGSLISRGDEGIRMNNQDLLPDLSMNSHQAIEHFNNPADNSLLNMTGTSFNVERINLANEARLKKWDSVGGGSIRSDGRNYDQYGGAGRGGYYNRGGGGGLEAIQEDDDANDNMAKIDKMLGGYLKTHEDLKAQDDHRY